MKKSILFLSITIMFFAFACSNAVENKSDESMTEETADDLMNKIEEEETERDIMVSELPTLVLEAVKAKYGEVEIEEIDEITDANGDVVYEIEFKKMNKEYEVIFTANSEFVKEEID